MKAQWLTLAGVIAAAVVLWTLASGRGETETPAVAAASDPEPIEPAAPPEAAQPEPARPPELAQAPGSPIEPVAEPTLDEAPAPAASPEPAEELSPEEAFKRVAAQVDPEQSHRVKLEKMRRRATVYDRLLAEERPDPEWRGELVGRLQQTFATVVGGKRVEVGAATCGTSVCRVELLYADLLAGDELLQMAPAARTLLRAPAMLLPDGEKRIQLYVAREGSELPEVTSTPPGAEQQQAKASP